MSKRYTYKYFDCTYEEMMYQYHEKYEKDYKLIGYSYDYLKNYGVLTLYERGKNESKLQDCKTDCSIK